MPLIVHSFINLYNKFTRQCARLCRSKPDQKRAKLPLLRVLSIFKLYYWFRRCSIYICRTDFYVGKFLGRWKIQAFCCFLPMSYHVFYLIIQYFYEIDIIIFIFRWWPVVKLQIESESTASGSLMCVCVVCVYNYSYYIHYMHIYSYYNIIIIIYSKSLKMVTAAMKLKDTCSLEEKLWPI